jgi:hypothetical protein
MLTSEEGIEGKSQRGEKGETFQSLGCKEVRNKSIIRGPVRQGNKDNWTVELVSIHHSETPWNIAHQDKDFLFLSISPNS